MNKGDKVVCINDKWEPWVFDTYNQLPKKGEVYTIRSVQAGRPNLDGGPAVLSLLLEEIFNDADFSHVGGDELAFRAHRFAPMGAVTIKKEKKEVVEL
jgi:hypothetical protein